MEPQVRVKVNFDFSRAEFQLEHQFELLRFLFLARILDTQLGFDIFQKARENSNRVVEPQVRIKVHFEFSRAQLPLDLLDFERDI